MGLTKVTCNTCKTEYDAMPMFEETKQAYRCSATVFLREGKHYLVGHYGSTVADMEMYLLDSDARFELGEICDDCIQELIADEKATLVKTGIW